jgi:hypothetical protein
MSHKSPGWEQREHEPQEPRPGRHHLLFRRGSAAGCFIDQPGPHPLGAAPAGMTDVRRRRERGDGTPSRR